ncbi:MAG TPA: RsmD family RNA methyltransferase [Rhizomicrobium sp.]|nr:RsmD family RNA methyltransferase [Rhizomicrobium sp.]
MTLCAHFGVCGGCTLQNLSAEAYRGHKRDMVAKALARAGLGDVVVKDPLLSPQKSRRRAVFKLGKEKGHIAVGFHAARSHAIVDMRECLVLTKPLLAFTATLRQGLAPILADGEKAEVHVSETGTGLDLAFRWPRKLTPALTAAIANVFGTDTARVIFNGEIVLERAKPQIMFDGVAVTPPSHAFLQATLDGERALQSRVLALTEGARTILDLFAGIGTFSLPLARRAKVHAVEQDSEALTALSEAVRKASSLKPVTTEKRNLFKTPLTAHELNRFDAVVLDPPRAGAEAQVRQLAAAKVPRVAYVSCDVSSFACDAAILANAGFRLGAVTPVDQFLYSDHIELVGGFSR